MKPLLKMQACHQAVPAFPPKAPNFLRSAVNIIFLILHGQRAAYALLSYTGQIKSPARTKDELPSRIWVWRKADWLKRQMGPGILICSVIMARWAAFPIWCPVKWVDGWPVLGTNGKVTDTLDLPAGKGLIPGIVASDDFTRKKGERALPLVWQWNHNPDNSLWSVTARKGYLRLSTGRIDTNFLMARNSLTQRTIGPVCSGAVSLDISKMKDGDFAGLGLLQKNYGLAGVKITGDSKAVVMINASTGKPVEAQKIPLNQKVVYFKANAILRTEKTWQTFFIAWTGKRGYHWAHN
jgi:hypothetical protein